MALVQTPTTTLGQTCPDFSLPGVDGKTYSLNDFIPAKGQKGGGAFVVMFICNHCPYVQAIEDRLIELGHELREFNIPLVAICSNDGESYPEDSFENLKKRWNEKKYPFPYLHDETQKTAKDFGAVCTPDFFVYDQSLMLAYRGRLDDSWKDPLKVTQKELLEATLRIHKNLPLAQEQIPSMGCSIKWITKEKDKL